MSNNCPECEKWRDVVIGALREVDMSELAWIEKTRKKFPNADPVGMYASWETSQGIIRIFERHMKNHGLSLEDFE